MISKTLISDQKPRGRQLNAKVCGHESAIFRILSFLLMSQCQVCQTGFCRGEHTAASHAVESTLNSPPVTAQSLPRYGACMISHVTSQALICIVLDDVNAERVLEKSSQANLSVEHSTSINIEWENAAMFLQPLHTTLLCSTRNDNHLTPQLVKFIHPSRYTLHMYVAKG